MLSEETEPMAHRRFAGQKAQGRAEASSEFALPDGLDGLGARVSVALPVMGTASFSGPSTPGE